MDPTLRRALSLRLLGLGLLLGLASVAGAVELRFQERNATRPMRVSTPEGEPLGQGTLTQWTEGDRLHVQMTYQFDDGRRIEESAVFRQQPELIQEQWNWSERIGEQTTRQYAIDFESGRATGLKREGKETRRYHERLEVEPGRTFAGVGFVIAAKNLLPRLQQGEEVKLHAISFTPKPRKVQVSLSHQGTEPLSREGQTLTAERVVIHPEIGLAALLVNVPDTVLYFDQSMPPKLLAGEGPLLEPDDPVVRTEVLSQ